MPDRDALRVPEIEWECAMPPFNFVIVIMFSVEMDYFLHYFVAARKPGV